MKKNLYKKNPNKQKKEKNKKTNKQIKKQLHLGFNGLITISKLMENISILGNFQ